MTFWRSGGAIVLGMSDKLATSCTRLLIVHHGIIILENVKKGDSESFVSQILTVLSQTTWDNHYYTNRANDLVKAKNLDKLLNSQSFNYLNGNASYIGHC
jgi:hypothetical protein